MIKGILGAILWLGVGRPGYGAPRASVEVGGEAVRIRAGGVLIAEYRHQGVPAKPYVSWLASPSGVNVVRDSVADHLHHHGLMFAVCANGVNYWEETPDCGRQRSEKVRAVSNGWEDVLAWSPQVASLPVLMETRRVGVIASPDSGATLLSWTSVLACPRAGQSRTKPPAGRAASVTLTGAHYHGLGMRFRAAMDGGSFENAEEDPGVVVRGEERLMRGRWCAYLAEVDGRPVTVAMFDHPANTRPATWFTMARPFGYLSATLRLHEEPLKLTQDRPLRIRYGVAVWDGRVERNRVENLYRAWLTVSGGRR